MLLDKAAVLATSRHLLTHQVAVRESGHHVSFPSLKGLLEQGPEPGGLGS